ncbi:MAG: Smr/MutS family protein [Kiritimatiellae bacterium]|nr:Smr/MutS family protein [Kiritimatiellia bacterium]
MAAAIPEYDLHASGMYVDDALAKLDRVISAERGRGGLFAVITGYGSTGGTSKIKNAVLSACRKYLRQHHIRGYLDGEKAGDMFSSEFLAFPNPAEIPLVYKRTANPGIVIIRA